MYEENSEIRVNAKYHKLRLQVGIARGRGRVMGWVVRDGMRVYRSTKRGKLTHLEKGTLMMGHC